ncbi:nuclear protein MDM1 isoform X3 [Boleophthalmus pectinirostris]|uniref:nuclear protein MDM1 isoform X3 n=1 Tax=Boleophthalmus pectinirostris TaxID=150288 RepID=UPI0024324284|nr:nuclear protein MDM1 isoform X3 [Boleophthalmus pectinirostris]
MKVNFKTEYQRSYRSKTVSPQLSAPSAGLRSDHMGISREPCLQRRKKFDSHHPLQSCGTPHKTLTIDAHSLKTPAALPPSEPDPPLEPQSTRQPSNKNMDTVKPETSDQFVMKSQQQSSNSPALLNPQGSSTYDHALRRKAGLRVARHRSDRHKTEYSRQFALKMAPTPPSPTLTAYEQALYSSHSTVPPFKKHPVSMDTEYQQSFQGLAPPTGSRLLRNLEHERTPLFHTQVQKRKNKSVPKNNPCLKCESPSPEIKVRQQSSSKPMSSDHAPSNIKKHRVLTEYESRFCYPLRHIPEETDATTSHTLQIKELREQALSYRRRAWGTNFSRDHLSQLLSEYNALWEPTETINSTEGPESACLDLCEVSSAGPGSGRSSCLEALDLASNASRSSCRDSAVGSKDGESNQTNKTMKTNATTTQSLHSLIVEDILPLQEDDKSDGEKEGRLPTPKLKMFPIQRTHLDLTTPATGGAILVGNLKGTDEVNQRSGTANSNAGTSEHIPVKPKEAWTADPTLNKAASKPIPSKNTPPLGAALPPTVPLYCIQGTLRNADFQHNGHLGLKATERKCATVSCHSDEDDRLSVMSLQSAASCTRASAILERAQRRRENFWGKS